MEHNNMPYLIQFDEQQITVLAKIMKAMEALPSDERPVDETDHFGDNVVNSLSHMFNDSSLLEHPAPMLHGFCL
jgi:hypothetical protein